MRSTTSWYTRGAHRMLSSGGYAGVGSTHRLSAVRWGVARRIVWAWVLTIPASALVAMLAYWLIRLINPLA